MQEAACERTPQDVIRDAAAAKGVRLSDVVGPARTKWISHARKACAVALKSAFPQMSCKDVAGFLGRKDHTSAMYYLGKRVR